MRKKLGLVPNRLGEAEQIQRYRDEIDQKLKLSTPPRNQKRVERVTFKYKHSFTNPPVQMDIKKEMRKYKNERNEKLAMIDKVVKQEKYDYVDVLFK